MSARAELICSQADPPVILGGVVPHTDLTVRSETGAWRWNAPKSSRAYDPGRMVIFTGTPRLLLLEAGQRPYL